LKKLSAPQRQYFMAMADRDALLPGWMRAYTRLEKHAAALWDEDEALYDATFAEARGRAATGEEDRAAEEGSRKQRQWARRRAWRSRFPDSRRKALAWDRHVALDECAKEVPSTIYMQRLVLVLQSSSSNRCSGCKNCPMVWQWHVPSVHSMVPQPFEES